MRGLATAFPRCVRGCPYLTAGVERVGHIASDGSSPAVASPPPVREVCASRRRRRGGSGRPRLPRDGPHERGELARDGRAGHGRLLAPRGERPVARRQPALMSAVNTSGREPPAAPLGRWRSSSRTGGSEASWTSVTSSDARVGYRIPEMRPALSLSYGGRRTGRPHSV